MTRPKKSPIWHPFTQHALQDEMTKVVRGEGAYLYAADGRRIIDAIASWWVVTHGHCHPHIVGAIQKQAEQLNQIIFAGYTHEPAEQVAVALLKLAPAGLDYVFFSDSGSTSVEVALKMALGYWRNIGEPRTRIVVMQHSYHGDTIGAMSVGARGVFNAAYGPLLFDVTTVPFPSVGHEQATLDALEAAVRNERPAAFIVEPLILGAGGMLMYPAWVLKEMKRICEASDVLFIADEVMTGWGRTGTLFACEQFGIRPDILVVSKQITSSYQPLAAVLVSDAIYQGVADQSERLGTFGHGFTASGHPVATAVGLENLAIIEERNLVANAAKVGAHLQARLREFAHHPLVGEVRGVGLIAAVELVADKASKAKFDPPGKVGLHVFEKAHEHGLIIRSIQDSIAFCPPLIITEAQVDEVVARFARTLDETQNWVEAGMPNDVR